ncbi:MBL fold metallo-hydrolase [[Pseudomonas] boreopolis]|uniref:MBL fold metallo-hydrolase n=1 Tax=Xanthomonas boreopolis TaxID=86183 RepID=UPI003D575D4F
MRSPRRTGALGHAMALAALLCLPALAWAGAKPGLELVVLGSGGPELAHGRASTSYLVREDGKAKLMIDAGAGAMANFARSGARIEDLQAVLLSHLHVDHSVDLASLVKASYFGDRTRDLPILGPGGNGRVPSTREFVDALFASPGGAYRYLSDYVDARAPDRYALRPVDIRADWERPGIYRTEIDGFAISAMPVSHGPIPALAWRIEKHGRAIVFAGDTSDQAGRLAGFAKGADVLVVHLAVADDGDPVANALHMPPARLLQRVDEAKPGRLVLSHIMGRTESFAPAFAGRLAARRDPVDVVVARDLDVIALECGEASRHAGR